MKKILEELGAWIKQNWHLEPKMIWRNSPVAMADMNNRKKWGPEAFFLSDKDKQSGKQMAVLVYFDGETDYEVCAYPQRLQNEIKWKQKAFGNKKRMTFNPSELDHKFRFRNINELKKEFLSRF